MSPKNWINQMHRCHAIVSFALPLCELQHSRSRVRQFSRRKSRRYTLTKSLKIHHVLVYRRGRYSRVVDLWIQVTDAAIGLRRASRYKEMWTEKKLCVLLLYSHKKMLHRARFFEKCSYVRLLLIDGGAVKKKRGHSTRKNKSNGLEPHFST